MARYDTDSKLNFTFSLVFYAATSGDADTIAKNTITKIFGASTAQLLDLTSTSSVALSGEAISGANYTYNYALDIEMGDSANSEFNTISAETAADALAALQSNAQRVTNITNMPLQVRYLRLAT